MNVRGQLEATPYAGRRLSHLGLRSGRGGHRPWYWDEPPCSLRLAEGTRLSTNTGRFTLHFDDEPAWVQASQTLEFHTWLVGVGKDGKPVWWGPGWGWTSIATAVGSGRVAFTAKALPAHLGELYYASITEKGTDATEWFTDQCPSG